MLFNKKKKVLQPLSPLKDFYEEIAFAEMNAWMVKTKKRPSILDLITKGTQSTINSLIPEKVHQVVTYTIEKMVKGILFGTKYITPSPFAASNLQEREGKVKKIIKRYRNAASAEGAITGAGGILMGLADFPAFLTIKMKMLFEIAAAYGHDVRLFEERLYLLFIFKLTFSSQENRQETIKILENWDTYVATLVKDKDSFDWKDFQLEYRDYMDLAKLAQLIPIIGAGVGAVANYKLSKHLGETAIQCYRMRYFDWKV
jgi:uncharacterized protein (DUF697 family)